jgi:hypothetical protein
MAFVSRENGFRREFEKSILASGENKLNIDLPLCLLYIYIIVDGLCFGVEIFLEIETS